MEKKENMYGEDREKMKNSTGSGFESGSQSGQGDKPYAGTETKSYQERQTGSSSWNEDKSGMTSGQQGSGSQSYGSKMNDQSIGENSESGKQGQYGQQGHSQYGEQGKQEYGQQGHSQYGEQGKQEYGQQGKDSSLDPEKERESSYGSSSSGKKSSDCCK